MVLLPQKVQALLLTVILTGESSKTATSEYIISNKNCSSVKPEQNHNCLSNTDCPTWFNCNDTQSAAGKCQCGPEYNGVIQCNEKTMISAVLNCYCVTETNGKTYTGLCLYNVERLVDSEAHQKIYHTISDKEDLNDYMCGRFNRTGILCGECQQGLSPYVLSYNLSCVECPDGHKNWWKFALVGFVPLTFFYFMVVFFNINVTSSRLHGYILFSQALSTPACVRILLITVEEMPFLLKAVKSLGPLYSLWNLDPFRSILPGICLNVDTLQVFALDACIAVYPLVLILLSYFLIELYDHNVWCIVFVWKPFHFIFRLFREHWDIRTSVIDSFATFFLLSYVKVLSVSTDLMVFTSVHELNDKDRFRLYYAANVEFFQHDHIPYALLSLAMLIFMITIPTLVLIFYPFRCFQKCLSCYQIRWHFLHAFVDSFQGCYKDGTEPGTYDLRWFSAYGLVLRFSICITFVLTLSSMYFIYALLAFILVVILLINFQPHKVPIAHNTTIDVSFLVLLSLLYISILGINIDASKGQQYLVIFFALAVISGLIPIVYITFIALHWMYSKRKCGGMILARVRVLLIGRKNFNVV